MSTFNTFFLGICCCLWGILPSMAQTHTPPVAPLKGNDVQVVPLDTLMDISQIKVPEDHGNPNGKTIDLAYHIVPAQHQGKKKDPMVFVTGGPGANTLTPQIIAFWRDHPMGRDRDIILFDQRGIGFSSALPNMSGDLFQIMRMDLDEQEELREMEIVLSRYKKRCWEDDIALEHYNTWQSAQDLGLLMKHLNYKKYNLYGVSYGTRLARLVQDLFPEMIHSSVLNSPSPIRGDFLLDRIKNYDTALEMVLENHSKEKPKGHSNEALKTMYVSTLTYLADNPWTITFKNKPFTINVQDALYLVRLALYSNDSKTLVPRIIKALHDRVAAPLLALIERESAFVKRFNSTLWLSVERFEMFRSEVTPKSIQAWYDSAKLVPYRLGTFDALYRAGSAWHGERVKDPSTFFQTSAVPTLILVNHYDPITPPSFGWLFKSRLLQGTLLVLEEGGHAGGGGHCKIDVINAFMNDPAKTLDIGCLKLFQKH